MPYQQVTLAQMRTMAYERGLGNNTSFFLPTEVDMWIREALRIWNVCSGYWRGQAPQIATTANNHWYTTPSQLTYILRVTYNDKPLNVSSLWDLDFGQPHWESETTTSGGNVPTVPTVWAPAGINQFAIWPADAIAGGALVCYGVVPAPQPTLDGDFVDLGSEELDAVIDYVSHISIFKEGGQEFEATAPMLQNFLKMAGDRNAQLMTSSKFRSWMGIVDEKKRPIRNEPARVGAR